MIKPGVRFCDIDAQARDYIDEKGYSEYWKIRLGHFIGQEDHEYGDVSPINKNVAEPGMIFSKMCIRDSLAAVLSAIILRKVWKELHQADNAQA